MAERSRRSLTDKELSDAMNTCAHKGEGCFADQPRALINARHGVGDMFIAAMSMRLVDAAVHAGETGKTLEEATFHEPALRDLEPEEAEGFTNITAIIPGQERTVAEAMAEDWFSKRLGNCAYKCGQSADCPIKP